MNDTFVFLSEISNDYVYLNLQPQLMYVHTHKHTHTHTIHLKLHSKTDVAVFILNHKKKKKNPPSTAYFAIKNDTTEPQMSNMIDVFITVCGKGLASKTTTNVTIIIMYV